MSARRATPSADKAAKNQAVIKELLKLPKNKHCADCKRNAHPRWASWNLGVFVCIRCSGIHRGMGTHISRVKSVDLDSWTDEQLQSVLRWGNSRANKYWEAKLAPGHVPSESKIENFIRTKYESKRWVMEGGMPDPSSLDDSDAEDTPLGVVKKKQEAHAASSPPPARRPPPNLFDADPIAPPTKTAKSPPPAAPVVPAQQAQKPAPKPADSLLGLDFFGPAPTGSPRSASAGSNPASASGGSTRPDLNRSILSLYSSAPKQTQRAHQHTNSGSFGGLGSPTMQSPTNNTGVNDLSGAFGDLTFAAAPAPQPAAAPAPLKPSPFANLTAGMMKSTPTTSYNGGSNAFSNFGSATVTKPAATSSSMGDLFDLGSTPSYQQKPAQPQPSSNLGLGNAWASSPSSNNNSGGSAGFNWSTPSTTTASRPPPKPAVADDDDFGAFSSGGFSSNPPANKPAVKYDDDIFKNVWG
ncbi:hypothetical protein AOL_s00004g405 [Orbilia oligospora ATCC 24927]|uniref:Arf-GAP domain-containing protein n=1 Tax=Arthrobotrys oligospora (strain ATCC 24927 / CBS 115.81 / DSM 1491) TaxID=756982 RepID=G1WYP4_ARTOA|nr:hypothetical protein AOL_s00004g405 [Orbilia oligospora ATCC 24927]EGX53746.1 hypothetical protein AOL_s00004g405 [Orbilia oligospora ATCC 24927]